MPSRRDALVGVAAATSVAVAGCGGLGVGGSSGETTGDTTPSDGDTTGTGGDTIGSDGTTASTDAAPAAGSLTLTLRGPDTERTLFDEGDSAEVGAVRARQTGGYVVPLTLTAAAADRVSERFREAGVADDPDAFEVVVAVDGETVQQFGIAPSLADAIATGEYDGEFVLSLEDEATARRVRAALVE
ncbi:hypothetical protein RYH80_05770 [Halobaculum sp. MBLA0147]|uniref:hypothetical protein n=1 Tax=Halobaculum sp. MBLA0147 TaxID=3079934 RepID=UPI003524E4BE